MSISITQVGSFDFAHSCGVLRMQSPAGVATEELFVPPRVYVKLAGSAPGPLPRVSGTLSPAQAAAAEQTVRAFWSALAANDTKAAEQTVLPAQRACFGSMTHGPRLTVTSLRIVSAQPAGNARATVRFTVKARASIGGHSVPVLPQGPARVQWLVTTEAGGHWYVDLGSGSKAAFGAACG